MSRTHDAAATRLAEIVGSEPLLAFLRDLAHTTPDAEWFIVGGAVRDAVLNRHGRKDFDLLVRGIDLEALAKRLEAHGSVQLVGARFGVLKFRPSGSDEEIDIAWPRTELAGGSGGYRDFAVQADPSLPVARDLARRDFTMNALAWDVRHGAFVDPHGGLEDIEKRVVRAVGDPDARFTEDYSRMLRAIRFACELGFDIEEATWRSLVRLAPRIESVQADGERVVPQETVAREFVKALAADPSRAVELLESAGLLFRLLPELAPLAACAQPADHHSEGDVWTHTKLALGQARSVAFKRLFPDEQVDAETAFALLLHDVAKPATAAPGPEGRTVFYGHAEQGALVASAVARRLRVSSVPGFEISAERIGWLVQMHLLPNMLRLDEVRRTTLEKHFLRDRALGRRLLHLAACDALASVRQDGTSDLSNLEQLLSVLASLDARAGGTKAKPLVSGEEVMESLGVGPGPQVGQLLETLREAQLNGEIATTEDAKRFLRDATTRAESAAIQSAAQKKRG